LTVNFSLGGTATPGGDYTGIIRRASDNVQISTFTPVASGNSVTLAADVNGIVVELRPTDDNLAEGTETISLQLTGVSGSQAFYPLGVNRSVDVYLLDNDASTIQVGFASNSSLIGEQLDPAGNVRQITVNLNSPSSQEISVRYRPTGGSAELGSDWTFLDSNGNPINEGVLTFAPGETTKIITVRVQSDRIPENQESFGIVLERPTGASLKSGYNTHFVTVYDVIPEG
ncbi:MAG: Calx-beta domain-containing protein, partial [Dolichospermum sp.]